MEIVKSKEGFRFIQVDQKQAIISEAIEDLQEEMRFVLGYFNGDSDFDRGAQTYAKLVREAAQRRVK